MAISTRRPKVLSRAEYTELHGFCQQYAAKRAALAMGGRERLARDVALIERAACLAGGEVFAPSLLRLVTTRDCVRRVLNEMQPPCGVNQFYALRRRFYEALRALKEEE